MEVFRKKPKNRCGMNESAGTNIILRLVRATWSNELYPGRCGQLLCMSWRSFCITGIYPYERASSMRRSWWLGYGVYIIARTWRYHFAPLNLGSGTWETRKKQETDEVDVSKSTVVSKKPFSSDVRFPHTRYEFSRLLELLARGSLSRLNGWSLFFEWGGPHLVQTDVLRTQTIHGISWYSVGWREETQ